MSTPVPTTEPSDLFVKMTSGKRPHKVVPLPRDGEDGNPIGYVAMCPLTQAELIAAAAESERRTRDLLAKGANAALRSTQFSSESDLYNNICACEVLFRACKDANDESLKRGAFKTSTEVANAMSPDEIGVLYHHYNTVKYELGPVVATMTDEEIDAWIKMFGEGGEGVPLDTLSWGVLTHLMLVMASRLLALQTDKSSLGSPVGQTEGSADSPEY